MLMAVPAYQEKARSRLSTGGHLTEESEILYNLARTAYHRPHMCGSIIFKRLYPGTDMVCSGRVGLLKGSHIVALARDPGDPRRRYASSL